GFGTPYERRQYKGTVTIESPDGVEVYKGEFSANDPNDIYKGHHVFKPDIILEKEGMWAVKVTLRNWKDENMWDFERRNEAETLSRFSFDPGSQRLLYG
ncbi:MAG TPA: hypothetical protein PKC98_15715, partial [Candidatus Melainabacteria bacterium]|nr:hypothetical protein [Candidatus Melainabacteria bacterium]